ncbi:unnamed protein product [Commensalibacter communis]|uniref:hypothetical protein n=1 Tax=Commensalibacter communis TaxID=2972786 RepID=UPI0022FF73F6|nr:hypothetical protein [Commensalibacter communis]CAI3926827.1 unnamed protein product [Commensalibacter communis]CAI3932507.1 unnamed protein product [Commensalibacter communis]
MNQKIDPKELKVLADILALVLEDQPGQSANALETIKKRAKKDTITGGALKNLFKNIANNPPSSNNTSNAQCKNQSDSLELMRARSHISNLTRNITQLDIVIRDLRRQNETLKSELLLTQRSRAELQTELYAKSDKFPFKTATIIVSILCGLFFGIAGTSVFNSAMYQPYRPDNTTYLH